MVHSCVAGLFGEFPIQLNYFKIMFFGGFNNFLIKG